MRILRAVGTYVGGILIGFDQFANTWIPGAHADETLSSRMGRRIRRFRKGKHRAIESEIICAVLDKLDDDHCAGAIEEDPDGTPRAKQLGRVIRELPPDPLDVIRRARRGAGE